jgi:threonine/homoserine/homoserine lactone efflux protein
MDPAFAAKVVVVSASGALAPGPLTASTAALGARGGWRAGFSVAVGHTLVELPLVVAIAYGVGSALSSPLARALLGAVGGAFMVLFAALTLKAAAGGGLEAGGSGRFGSALAAGAALSLFNPFFIMWWLGVGSPLIAEAVERGARGLLEFYAAHVWIDYAWLSLVAGLGSVARLNGRAYRALLAALALLMLYFGASTALTAASWLAG